MGIKLGQSRIETKTTTALCWQPNKCTLNNTASHFPKSRILPIFPHEILFFFFWFHLLISKWWNYHLFLGNFQKSKILVPPYKTFWFHFKSILPPSFCSQSLRFWEKPGSNISLRASKLNAYVFENTFSQSFFSIFPFFLQVTKRPDFQMKKFHSVPCFFLIFPLCGNHERDVFKTLVSGGIKCVFQSPLTWTRKKDQEKSYLKQWEEASFW